MCVVNRLLTMIVLLSLLSACQVQPRLNLPQLPAPPEPVSEWRFSDIRLFDPIDSDITTDLIAGYAKQVENSLTFRVDFLELLPDADFRLALVVIDAAQTTPAQPAPPFEWTQAISVTAWLEASPNATSVDFFTPQGPVSVTASWIHVLDYAILQFPAGYTMPPGTSMVFLLYHPDTGDVVDQTDTFTLDTIPDIAPANVLLAFSDVLPAATPLQLQRRWDGAHTGPFGQRHGLHHLLENIRQYHIPVVLLDLKHPFSLKGLELSGGLDLARALERSGLLSLPDTATGSPSISALLLKANRATAGEYGFMDSPFAHAPITDQNELIYSGWFINDSSGAIRQVDGIRYISTNQETTAVWDRQGFTLAGKELLFSALSQPKGVHLNLGGDLTSSAFADSTVAPLLFRYLAEHPWLRVLSGADLLDHDLPVSSAECGSACQTTTTTDDIQTTKEQMDLLEETRESDLSHLVLLAMASPTHESTFTTANFLMDALIWSQNPIPQAQCDGHYCLLSDNSTLLILDTRGAQLLFAFSITGQGVQQWAGPIEQYIPDQDASNWIGSFVGADHQDDYIPTIQPGVIVLTHPVTGIVKQYSISNTIVSVTLTTAPDQACSVHVNPGVAQLLHQGSLPVLHQNDDTLLIETGPPGDFSLQSNTVYSLESSLPAASIAGIPENPDAAIPTGALLPLAFTRITFPNCSSLHINIQWQP